MPPKIDAAVAAPTDFAFDVESELTFLTMCFLVFSADFHSDYHPCTFFGLNG